MNVVQKRRQFSVITAWSPDTKSHVKSHRAVCSNADCDFVELIRDVNKGAGLPEQVVVKKFRERGWLVGPKGATCPACATKSKERLVSEHKKESPVTTQTAPPESGAPRQPTREDRRRVQDALDLHYIVERGKYQGDWNDKKLAEHLKVPRAWVSEERERAYGPDASEVTSLREAKIAALSAQIDSVEGRVMEELARLDTKLRVLRAELTKLVEETAVEREG